MQDNFGIARGLKKRAAVLELSTQCDGVHQIAVVCYRDLATGVLHEQRLGVCIGSGPGR